MRINLQEHNDYSAPIRYLMQFSPNKRYLLLQFPLSTKYVGRVLDLTTKSFSVLEYPEHILKKKANPWKEKDSSPAGPASCRNSIAESVFSTDSQCFITLSKLEFSVLSSTPILSVWHISGIELQRVTNFGPASDFSTAGKLHIQNHSVLIPGQTFRIDFRSEESSSADPKCVPLSEEELLDAKQKTASPDRKLLRLPNGESFAFSVSGNGSEVRIEKLDHQSVVVSSSPLLWIPYAKIVSLYTENGILCAMDSLEQLHLLESPQFHRSALLDTSSFSALAIKKLLVFDESGVTPLYTTCAQRTDSDPGRNSSQVQQQVETLLSIGANILQRMRDGSTVLHAAASSDQLGVIEILVRVLSQKLGWSMPRIISDFFNHQNDDGDTALHFACRASSKLAVEFLLTHGADLRIQNKEGTEPLMSLLDSKHIISRDDCGRQYVNSNFIACGQFLLQYCSLDLAKKFQTQLDEKGLVAIGKRHASRLRYENYFDHVRPLLKNKPFQPFSLRRICARFYRRRIWLLEQLKQKMPEEMINYVRSVDEQLSEEEQSST